MISLKRCSWVSAHCVVVHGWKCSEYLAGLHCLFWEGVSGCLLMGDDHDHMDAWALWWQALLSVRFFGRTYCADITLRTRVAWIVSASHNVKCGEVWSDISARKRPNETGIYGVLPDHSTNDKSRRSRPAVPSSAKWSQEGTTSLRLQGKLSRRTSLPPRHSHDGR